MKITYLGHSGFRIESGKHVLLIDPWLRGNPSFDESRFDEAIKGATHILLSHAHADHASTAPEIARAAQAEIIAIFDLATILEADDVVVQGFNKGGTLDLGAGVAVTMVHAVHSSTMDSDGRMLTPGSECGYMIKIGGKTIYFAGDTDVMADMALFQDLHAPDIGLIPIGGRFTMDAKRAAYACKKFFAFETIIPCHYKTFGLLAQSADAFISAVAPMNVVELDVMRSFEVGA